MNSHPGANSIHISRFERGILLLETSHCPVCTDGSGTYNPQHEEQEQAEQAQLDTFTRRIQLPPTLSLAQQKASKRYIEKLPDMCNHIMLRQAEPTLPARSIYYALSLTIWYDAYIELADSANTFVGVVSNKSHEGGNMKDEFKVGDHVEWNSEAGRVTGTIIKKVTSEITFKGYKVHASEDEPRYLIKSDKTDHEAMHKGSALKKIKKTS